MPFLRRPAAHRLKFGSDSKRLESTGSYVAPSRPDAGDSVLDSSVSPDEVRRLFRAFLFPPIGDSGFVVDKARSGITLTELIEELLHSPEFQARYLTCKVMSGGEFRIPKTLAEPLLIPRHVLLIGSCAADVFHDQIVRRAPQTRFEKITFNSGDGKGRCRNSKATAQASASSPSTSPVTSRYQNGLRGGRHKTA